MPVTRNGNLEPEDPKVGWKDRVAYANGVQGTYAYRPGEVVTTRGEDALALAMEMWPDDRADLQLAEPLGPCARLVGVPKPLRLIEELRIRGIVAQPHHVFFIHCGCPPHPASCGSGVNPATINPATINPATINPATINPATINPACGNPCCNQAGINPATINPATINPATINPASINPGSINSNHPARLTGLRRSSARPAAPAPDVVTSMSDRISVTGVTGAPKVVVLDTGLAAKPHLPIPLQSGAPAIQAAPDHVDVSGQPVTSLDAPDSDQNQFLDPAAGHGTFIAGVITQVAPGCEVTVHRVATIYGDTDEFTAGEIIRNLVPDDRTMLNLSFGGYTMDGQAMALAWAIRQFQSKHGVVVASAGNDSSCEPSFPAALPDVVSVGSVGPGGPAAFTNYGPWVRACAPGVHLTSMFFTNFQGNEPPGPDGTDPDLFDGWAIWSGTSFSAPVVVGALARVMMASGCSAEEAVQRVIDAPELMRIPNLGTVVNVI